MIGFEAELRAVLLLVTESEEALYGGLAVRAPHPAAACAPFEAGGFRCIGEGLAGAQQRLYVHAIVDWSCGRAHFASFLFMMVWGRRAWPPEVRDSAPTTVGASVESTVEFSARTY